MFDNVPGTGQKIQQDHQGLKALSMKRIGRFLLSRWALSLLGCAVLGLLVWFFLPLIEPLSWWLIRLGIIIALLLVWACVNLLLDWRRSRRENALAAGITGTDAAVDPTAVAKAEEVQAIRDKLATAMTLLRKASKRRGYLYEQPWYVIIGPPGAGKTTALLNSGLNFPLAAEMGEGAVAGVAGTRLCEWWFTDHAALIDTAGRYTTHDSDAAVDRAGWEAFLDLLKRTRIRQPLNGVIVAIGLTDIAQASPEERSAHARAVRLRVKELDTRLEARLPIYLIFTKADLIAGFTEFFDDLDRDRRAQVWGMTFPVKTDESDATAGGAKFFLPEFQALVSRIDAQLVDRLQAERSPERRSLIAGFPAQLASLEQPLAGFLQEAFGGSRLDPAPFLRGAYVTSATQEGSPIDRLTGSLARTFGLDQRRIPGLRPEKGRSYFITRLATEVIFGEAMLVTGRPGAARRRRLIRAGAFAAIGVAALLVAGSLWHGRNAGAGQIAAAQDALAAYEHTASGVRLDPVNDADLPRLAPLLDQAAALPYGANTAAAHLFAGFGLSQNAKLMSAGETVYRHALQYALLPRLIWQLETEMRGRLNDPDFMYQATRVYLMLGGAGPLDRGLVHEWMTLDWETLYPGAAYAPVRASLLRHLDALLSEPLPSLLLDGGLVAQARATFSRVSLAQRVYSRIRLSAAAQAVPPWKPRDALGPAGAALFVRASGKSMDDPIPGFYTVAGFHDVLLPSLGSATRTVASESWVLGKNAEVSETPAQLAVLEHEVIGLYENDYAHAWDAMLNDIDVIPMRSVSQAAEDLYVLASPQSPMRDLLASMAHQLTLSAPTEREKAAAAAQKALTGGKTIPGVATSLDPGLAVLFPPAQAGQPPPAPPGHEIDERYKRLRELVGNGPGSPLDAVLRPLNDLQQLFAKLAAAPVGAAAPPGTDDPTLAVRVSAAQQPQPLSRWMTEMAASAQALRGGNARQQLVAAFNGANGPASLCNLAVNNHYPFVPGSPNDVPLDDFAHLFAPGGQLDGFFNTQLRPYVDTSGKTWQPQPVDGIPPPVTAADVAQFQRAAVIRDLFFAGGGTTPGVRFDITPVDLDVNTLRVTLDLGGTSIVSAHGPPRATQITWPGQNRMESVRLIYDPAPPGTTGVIEEKGPWAMFRLFGQARVQPGESPDLYTLTFDLGGRTAIFQIRAASLINPFAPGVLQDFHCPSVQ